MPDNTRISDLPEATSASPSDFTVVVTSGSTHKIPIATLVANSGSAITGVAPSLKIVLIDKFS